LLIKEYRKTDGEKRLKIKYFILGSLAGWIGGHCNFLLSFNIDVYPYANFLPIVYVAVFAYAILRHKLLDIEVIIKKTIIFAGLFTIVYGIFAFFALLGQTFFERFITQNRWVAMIPSVLVVTVILRPLENFLKTVTDKYLFQKKYDYKELLKKFSSEVLSVLELDKLIILTEERLSETMKLDYCKVLITDSPDIKIEAMLKLPISAHDKIMGFLLLGRKKSDEDYTQEDLDILQPLVKTLAIAISNARLVEELNKAQADMAEKDKMATVGTLAAGMAHEIRNPITTIRVFSEYVPDRLNDNEFRGKYRDIVVKEVDKIDHIIQTLIDFSGDNSVSEIENVSIEEAVDELISLIGLNKKISGRIKFVKEIPQNIPRIKVNRKEFDEIILNLAENAIHAIEDGGQITFKAQEKNEFVELTVIDTGCGMSEETVKNIFSPFFTTRSKGFGLGLFVVKQLVKRNGGAVLVESKIGHGTKFSLKFKRVQL
jgi:signal transduction histidine kinase